MTPTAISTDAKASPRGPAGAGSATPSAGPDFDGVLTSLGGGAAVADGGAGTQGPAIAEQTLVAPRLAGNESILSMLVDKATGANETAAPSKGADHDDGADASSRPDSGQVAIPLGLMSMLIATATPSMTSASAAAEGAETRGVAAAAVKEGVDPIAAGAPKAGAASAPVAAEVAEAFPGGVPDLKSTKPLATQAGDPDAGEASTAEASEALPGVLPDMKSATTKPVTTKAADPIAAADTEAGRTIQSVSVSTQIAPSPAHASQPEIPSLTNATAATGAHGASAERTSATTAKTETSMQGVANPAMTTITSIADAISNLADAAAAAPAGATVPAAPTTATMAPARTMVLQLAPADLGTVAVRLHLTGQTLDVQLSVSDPKTLGLVSRERDALAARLDDRGYQLNTLVIQGTDPSTSSTAGSHDTSHNGPGASADRDQGAEGGRRGASGQPDREAARQAAGDSARGDASVDGRGGLYI